jgi:hypothetical protein
MGWRNARHRSLVCLACPEDPDELKRGFRWKRRLLTAGKKTDFLMRIRAVLGCLVLMAGVAVLCGCVSDDTRFVDTFSEWGTAIRPDMDAFKQSITDHDFNASQSHCRELLAKDRHYLSLLSGMPVSEKYNSSRQFFLSGLENEIRGCQAVTDSPDGDLAPSMVYFKRSEDDFAEGIQLWPE